MNIVTHHSVPARLSSSGDALVHHVIGNQKVGLKLNERNRPDVALVPVICAGRNAHQLDAPSQKGSLEVLFLCQVGALEDLDGIDDRHSSVEFTYSGSSLVSPRHRMPSLDVRTSRCVVVEYLKNDISAVKTPAWAKPTRSYHSTASLGMPSFLRYAVNSSTIWGKMERKRSRRFALLIFGLGTAGSVAVA